MNKRGSIAITQILILLIGILAFSYIVGEIGKQRGIEVSRGIGFVGAQTNECDESGECTVEGGSCAASDECAAGLVCQNNICAKELSTQRGINDPDLLRKTEDAPGIYQAGDILVAKDGSKSNPIKEEELEKGNLKEGSEAVKWIKNLGGTYAGGKITNGLDKILREGKPTDLNTGVNLKGKLDILSYSGESSLGSFATITAGAAVGSFLVWAFYKWIVKADVRNMRDVTNAAFIGGGVAIATTYAIGAGYAGAALASYLGIAVTAGVATGPVGWIALAIAVIVVALITLFTFKNYSAETFTYIVTAWKAEKGGDFCEKCNDLKYGCTEYQCKSFGKGCEIENKGTAQEICVWKNPKDILSPVINASLEVLPSVDYSYQPLQVVQGVKVNYPKDPSGKGCIPPYTALTLGIETDEFADCKIDIVRTPDFASMVAPMTTLEGFAKEHKLDLPHVATPSVENQQAAGILDTQITNGQAQEFYIRCEDANGNSNTEEFIMEFCVQDGPDTSAPIILGTNFVKTGFLQYNQTDTYLEVYTNEPAECKWSPEDLDYDSMQFDMSQCSMSEGDYLFSGFGYGCKGTLTGLKDKMENKFYIKCKDKPWWTSSNQGQRYANEEPFILTLIGTEPLLIDKITVNGKSNGAKIKDSTDKIKAKLEITAKFGAQQGKAKCEYESGGNFVGFYNEGNTEFVNVNTQNLYLAEGDYNISIRCSDAGGNSDKGNIEFSLETDREAPITARAYYDANNLKVITNEPAECVYTTQSNIACDYEFKDGTAMSDIGELTHYTSWQPGKKYFIKCKDAFGNQPVPGQCSIIVKAFESYK